MLYSLSKFEELLTISLRLSKNSELVCLVHRAFQIDRKNMIGVDDILKIYVLDTDFHQNIAKFITSM